MAQIYHSPPVRLPIDALENEAARIDLEFTGVDHSMVSYEARIYANNPEASETTEPTEANGYLGSFVVFGHGGCVGDEGHCRVPRSRRPYDKRPRHKLTPQNMRVKVTKGLKRVCSSTPEVRFTVVPVVYQSDEMSATDTPLKFDTLSVITYD